jgi:molybdopterin converting factor small subunit
MEVSRQRLRTRLCPPSKLPWKPPGNRLERLERANQAWFMLDFIMRVRVLLFGPLSDAAGRAYVEVDLPESADCRTLGERLAAAHPQLAPSLACSRIAVNHEFAHPMQPIRAGDEIALIGLVSGG